MDNAFKTKPFPGLTTKDLKERVASYDGFAKDVKAAGLPFSESETFEKMKAEVDRREKVAAGDVTMMYPAERRRYCEAHPDFDFRTVKLLYP